MSNTFHKTTHFVVLLQVICWPSGGIANHPFAIMGLVWISSPPSYHGRYIIIIVSPRVVGMRYDVYVKSHIPNMFGDSAEDVRWWATSSELFCCFAMQRGYMLNIKHFP